MKSEIFLLLHYICGYSNLACWTVVFVPQFYANYRRKSGDSVSLRFIYIWLVADSLATAGAILGNLALTQLLLATYSTVVDILLLSQIYYYRSKTSKYHEIVAATEETEPLFISSGDDDSHEQYQEKQKILGGTAAAQVNVNSCSVLFLVFLSIFVRGNGAAPADPVNLQTTADLFWTILKNFCGYGSTALYLTSRIPQIHKNWKNKSCEGLSMLLFVFTVSGNITYFMQILFEYLAYGNNDKLVDNIPYLIGSLGTLVFDFVIFLQFYYYRHKSQDISPQSKSIIIN